MEPMIDHIHIMVEDLERAERFYDALLPLLGFDISLKEYDFMPEHGYRIVEYHHNRLSIGLLGQGEACRKETLSRTNAGALHHLAFQAKNPEEVDALYLKIKEIGALIIHAPQYDPAHWPDYYAFSFRDCEGIAYEIASFERGKYFPGNGPAAGGQTAGGETAAMDSITVVKNGAVSRLLLTEIYYFESVDERTFVYAKSKVYECDEKLYEIEAKMGTHGFARISKSTIVNIRKIREIKPQLNGRFEALLDNGERQIVNRHYVSGLKDKFMENAK